MARNKFSSPTLQVTITAKQYEEAKQSKSGGCLIADAIKEQYPQYTGVAVDVATIRLSDKKAGKRYTYLTPEPAQLLLLSYDQGWAQATEQVMLRRAVQVAPIYTSQKKMAAKAARVVELEAKEAAGEMTAGEKAALTTLRKHPVRPTSPGPADVKVDPNAPQGKAIVAGGKSRKQGKSHPNLLRGHDRHFGAKLADPGEVFNQAVEEAVTQRLAEQSTTA